MAYHDTSHSGMTFACFALLSGEVSLCVTDRNLKENKTNAGQPVAYPPLHGHRGSVYINRSYEKAEARDDPAHKVRTSRTSA